MQRTTAAVNSNEIDVYVPPEALFPDLKATDAAIAVLLGTLKPRRRNGISDFR
jgi:hypothetical protein